MFMNGHSGVRSMCIVFASSWLLGDARERLTSQEVAGYVVQTLGVGVYQYSRLLAQHQHQPEAPHMGTADEKYGNSGADGDLPRHQAARIRKNAQESCNIDNSAANAV
jgi:hypothetical protein